MRGEPVSPVQRIYPTPGARRRAVAAWCLFDFANSSYTTLIVTVAFSVYFRQVVVDAPGNTGDRLWGVANSLAFLIVALTSPVAGAMADHSGRKRTFLVLATLQAVAATALLATVGPGQVRWAMGLYVLGTIGFEGGYVFYNAFLPEISTPRTIGKISGWGWAVGFLGGLLALLLCAPLLSSDLADAAGRIVPAAIRNWQAAFLVVSVFYLVFALPAFVWLRDARSPAPLRQWRRYVGPGISRVGHTLRHLRRYRETAKFVVASLLFNDGITTVIAFSAIFATVSFGFGAAELLRLFIVLNIVAFPGALVAGYVADRLGAKRTLVLTLLLWVAVVLTGYLAVSRTAFWIMAVGAALGMGSTQAVARSYMAQISPPALMSEFFGFYVLSGKFAAISGPLLFGVISEVTGSQRLAVLSLLPLFLAGLVLLLTVDDAKARQVASPG